MFTEHGLVALVKFAFIVILCNLLAVGAKYLLGWEDILHFLYAAFLCTYIVNYEGLKVILKDTKQFVPRVRDPE